MQKDVVKQRAALSAKNQKIRGFRRTCRDVEPGAVPQARGVRLELQKHVTATDVADKSLDEDVQKELARQRVFLEKPSRTSSGS